jgi:pimeloyl-ACP methyl ester carboxylesterase
MITYEIKSVEFPNQITLPYVEQGEATGMPVLLLHGFAGSWRAFRPVLEHLPVSLHAFALTQRGQGEASKPADGYRLRDLAADVAAFMEAVQLEAAVVVGHSMGSAVAQRFAVDHPDKTLGLVLAGTCVTRPGDPDVQAFWDSTVSKLSDPIDPDFLRSFGQSLFAQPIPQATFEALVEDVHKVPARVWKALWKGRLEEDLSSEVNQIKVPTLIVWGDQDTRCPRADQDTLIDAIPNARLEVYQGAGHELHVEEPERFAGDLAAFIEERVR